MPFGNGSINDVILFGIRVYSGTKDEYDLRART
jgi:hypothetical protein